MSSFSLSGGVQVFGFISPSDTTDQYPVIDPLYGIDGLRNVDLLSDLDAIPSLRRRSGMVVGVSGGTSYYKLNPSPWTFTSSDWEVFNSSGGSFTGGTVTGDTIFTNGLTTTTFSATTITGATIFSSGNTIVGGQFVSLGGTSVTSPTYRVSLGGSNISPRASFGVEGTGANFHRYSFDPVNQRGLAFTVSNNNSLYIDRASIVGIGILGAPGLETGALVFKTLNASNNSERMRINNLGNVGIGTDSPTEKLDVVGKTKTTNIQITSGATNGYVLTSDVSGNGTWEQIPSFTGGEITTNRVIHVMSLGNDNTAIPYRLDKPYATPWTAISAATSGDTVIVYPGLYNNTNTTTTDYLAKNGITLYMYRDAIIQYSSLASANTVIPLYDRAMATNFTIKGNGTLILNQFGGTSVNNLFANSLSFYDIELDTYESSNRLRSSTGSYFKLKARSIRVANPEFIAFRNSVSNAINIYIDCDIFDHYASTNTLTPFDIRNVSTSGIVDIRIKTYKSGRVFTGFGCFYFENVQANLIIRIDRFLENTNNVSGTRPIFYSVGGMTLFDIQILNINHTGGLFDFATAGSSIANGKIKMTGNIQPYLAHRHRLNFNTNSKVEIDLDINYNDSFETEVFTMTNVVETVYVTGKIKHTIGSQNPATTALFVNQNSGGLATTMATLKNLTVETNANQLVYGTGTSVGNVKCMGVYSNKPFDIYHVATVEPLIVDSSIKV